MEFHFIRCEIWHFERKMCFASKEGFIYVTFLGGSTK